MRRSPNATAHVVVFHRRQLGAVRRGSDGFPEKRGPPLALRPGRAGVSRSPDVAANRIIFDRRQFHSVRRGGDGLPKCPAGTKPSRPTCPGVGRREDISVALGGRTLTTTVEGLQRYSINLRYDRDFRSDLRALREDIVVPTPTGAQIPLGQLATVKVVDGPMGIKSEGAVPNAWVYVDIRGVDVGTYVQMARHAVNEAVS
ncbi:MAG: efflux RND transporter permease subunit, partial [Verrucomicrobia bacterium]|nr:efflux RND transporter permease subunit [Verrucomicrobiota bacterium]